eukprot:jgi/Mesvir1/2399/Mv22141-RA.1
MLANTKPHINDTKHSNILIASMDTQGRATTAIRGSARSAEHPGCAQAWPVVRVL